MHLHGIVRLKDTESGANISMNNLLLRSKESKRQHSWPVAVQSFCFSFWLGIGDHSGGLENISNLTYISSLFQIIQNLTSTRGKTKRVSYSTYLQNMSSYRLSSSETLFQPIKCVNPLSEQLHLGFESCGNSSTQKTTFYAYCSKGSTKAWWIFIILCKLIQHGFEEQYYGAQ